LPFADFPVALLVSVVLLGGVAALPPLPFFAFSPAAAAVSLITPIKAGTALQQQQQQQQNVEHACQCCLLHTNAAPLLSGPATATPDPAGP